MTEREKKAGAKRFAEAWANRGDEKQETQRLGADASLRRGNGRENIHRADARSVAPQSVAPQSVAPQSVALAPLVASVSPKRSDNPDNPQNPCGKISETAQSILDVRARYPDASLADLYDPLTMPPDLRKAHRANDAAVLAAYGLPPDISEPALVAHLMSLYQKRTVQPDAERPESGRHPDCRG